MNFGIVLMLCEKPCMGRRWLLICFMFVCVVTQRKVVKG